MADELQMSGYDDTRAKVEASTVERELKINTGANELSMYYGSAHHRWPAEERLATANAAYSSVETITSGAQLTGVLDDSFTAITGNTDLQTCLKSIDTAISGISPIGGYVSQDGSTPMTAAWEIGAFKLSQTGATLDTGAATWGAYTTTITKTAGATTGSHSLYGSSIDVIINQSVGLASLYAVLGQATATLTTGINSMYGAYFRALINSPGIVNAYGVYGSVAMGDDLATSESAYGGYFYVDIQDGDPGAGAGDLICGVYAKVTTALASDPAQLIYGAYIDMDINRGAGQTSYGLYINAETAQRAMYVTDSIDGAYIYSLLRIYQNDASGGRECLLLDQADQDESFTHYVGYSNNAADFYPSIMSDGATRLDMLAATGWIKVTVTDNNAGPATVDRYIALHEATYPSPP